MSSYSTLPKDATLDVQSFTAHVDEQKLQHFKQLLDLSPIAPIRYENTRPHRTWGIQRDWLEHAKVTWLNDFDWRKCEDRINSFPNFKTTVGDQDGNEIEMHFLALFSENPDAVPIVFLHGWPGSICEFFDILDLLKHKYTPSELPYHVIVPSLPGYAYSGGPPTDKEYGVDIAADAINNVMMGLGFGSGYIAQGGDLGSFVSRILALKYDSCKGMHVNMMGMPPTGNPMELAQTDFEKDAVHKAQEMLDTGYGWALEQGQKPATIGHVLSASPIALLAWMADGMLQWSDKDPSLEKILEGVTLYWMTDTISRCFYHNRGFNGPGEGPRVLRFSVVSNLSVLQLPYVAKPCGYSRFAHEVVPVPDTWAAKSCNLVSFNDHKNGGHFAAMERPGELLADVEEFVKKAWQK